MIKLRNLWLRDKGLCWLCGNPVPWGTKKKALRATRDHVHHLRRGGPNHHENLRLAHSCCNNHRDFEGRASLSLMTSMMLVDEPHDVEYYDESLGEWEPKDSVRSTPDSDRGSGTT